MTVDGGSKQMRAFVTGGSGFIGGHLISSLLGRGFEVGALVHRTPIRNGPRLQFVSGDICDREDLEPALEGVDVLFHLASALGSRIIGQAEFHRINVLGTETVLEAARRTGVGRIVHVSSAGVFGAVRNGEVVEESSSPAPITVYDRTKLEGEEIALRFAGEESDVVIVRPGWAYGPRDRRTFKLIKSVCGGRFMMVTRGSCRQTPVFIDDLVKGILLASEKGERGGIYHLAGREIMTVREMVRATALACGKRPPRFFLPLFPARLAARLLETAYKPIGKEAPFNRSKLSFFIHSKPLSIEKARRELGFEPDVCFQNGINRTIFWYRNEGWLPYPPGKSGS
ncbi:MAG: NAD-dependent epimerase/dehydratase family protein [Candidatus Aminicenantes bacterium]|nr:NAD-dependent epimerase/dehydratase family protein [Candidatus Aminicenantes bacterium]